ncbi:MAG: VWA-like domain-containing protein [Alphaproteobacteria bacterium]|nr:VWA-like domain-containing protein [Alphaproteobacteria bacterium]MCL2505229.1 VWA-like domain-containing protein [Alphaproteobacteria bacterium]
MTFAQNILGKLFRNTSEEVTKQKKEIEAVHNAALRKFPLFGVQMSKLKTVADDSVKTVGTDGKTIYYSPKYFETLTHEEKVFVYAHEVMHTAFNHILRSKDRDHDLWNTATDAVINQILKTQNMPMPEGVVDMEEAINKSAEEMYEKLLKEKEENSEGGGDSEENKDKQAGHDNHDIWKKAVEQHDKEQSKQKQACEQQPQDDSEFEKGFAEQNQKEKAAKAAEARENLKRKKNRAMANAAEESARTFGEVGESDAAVNWKTLLKRTIETQQYRWSYRRSNADNDFMARVEERDEEDKAETEVLLDTSGSVSDEFLREFLRQLKPLLKDSKLRVGCFDHRFHPFVEIKTNKDIDNFKIPSKGNTDWDLAVKSFTPKKHINKIIFTDGERPGKMPDASTKGINVIWLVYGDEEFNPICGKVIRVPPKQIKQNFVAAPSSLHCNALG